MPAHRLCILSLSFTLPLDAILHFPRDGPTQVCGGFLSRQTEEYFLPRMLQDLTKQVSLGEENSSVRLFLWSGPWGQDPWGQSHGITVSHVRKTQTGVISVTNREGPRSMGEWVPPCPYMMSFLSSGSHHGMGSVELSGWGFLHHPGQLFPAGLGLQPRDCPRSRVWGISDCKTHGRLYLAPVYSVKTQHQESVLSCLWYLAVQV